MRELFLKLFAMSHFNTGIKVTAFSVPHIVYLVLIFGGIVAAGLILRNKSMETKDKVLRILAYALVISYLSDFFMHDFVYGEMNMDKLPFHICTVMCPLVAFAQFNKRFKKFLEPITAVAIVGPLMYLCYPASIGEGEPWCYQAVQTMFFHGVELAWGILNITTKKVEFKMKNIWHSAVLLVAITLWAKLGNEMLGNNWFFLQEDAFYIGLVGSGILPQWSLMILNPIAVFLVVLAVYGIYYGVNALIKNASSKTVTPVAATIVAEVAATEAQPTDEKQE
ncbi:MAG: YwaF family protein [Clostridia bacterium]|nr:YwaF family protein [Clostridia bacterium]